MRRNSIQNRLLSAVLLSQTLLTVGLVLTGVAYTYWRLLSTLDNGMQSRALRVAALVRYIDNSDGKVYFDNSLLPPPLDPEHPDLFAVWASRSGLLYRSEDWPQELDLKPGPDLHWNFEHTGVPYHALRLTQVKILDRGQGRSFRPQTLTIVYASPTSHLIQQVKAAGAYIALISLALMIIALGIAFWGVRRGLQPLQTLAAQAGMVSTQNWELSVPPEVEKIEELRPLIESMIQMLERLRRSFDLQRQFLGSAAHELKTPVAVLKSTLQQTLQRPRTNQEYEEALENSLEDLGRLEQLLQWMLRLARAEQWAQGALRRDLDIVDLTATWAEAIERAQPLADANRTTILFLENGQLPFRADPEDLQLVWSNLLENAIRYSPQGSTVEVKLDRNRESFIAEVLDHGVGISTTDLPHIFERFYRGDGSRTRSTGGFGLGLAIARALVEAYGGSIQAESQPGQGTRMIVRLPAGPKKISASLENAPLNTAS
jgi:signal transduction histidine kinase